MAQHTPGPWKVNNENENIWILANPNENVICDMVGRIDNPKTIAAQFTDEDIANAHLIAAAPELLDASEQLLYQMSIDGQIQLAASDLADIIAKAKGE